MFLQIAMMLNFVVYPFKTYEDLCQEKCYMRIAIVGRVVVSLFLFTVPIGYVVYSLVAQQQIAIDFAAKERQGNRYLDAVRSVQFDVWMGRESGEDNAVSIESG